MKWSNRRSVFVSVSFFHGFIGPTAATFVFAPPFPKRISRNSPQLFPEQTRILRVCGTSAPNFSAPNFSISITFDIAYERLTDYVYAQTSFTLSIFTSAFEY
jgi:hypothetical protein